jgi:inosine-uridine nucleoside N-ribohydrolase
MLAVLLQNLRFGEFTTVAGNQTGEKNFANALKILTLIGKDLPVARGLINRCFRACNCPEIHRRDGLDGADLLHRQLNLVKFMRFIFIAEHSFVR